MVDIYKLKELYPLDWIAAEGDELAFVSILAAKGLVPWEAIEETKRWLELAPPKEVPPPELPPPIAPTPLLFRLATQYPDLYEKAGRNIFRFLELLIDEGIVPPPQATMTSEELEKYWEGYRAAVGAPPTVDEKIKKALWEKVSDAVIAALRAMWLSLGRLIKEEIWPLLKLVWDKIVEQIGPALKKLDDKLTHCAIDIYDKLIKRATAEGHITPEKAPVVALDMYKFAFAAGLAAHASATLLELLHPLKRIGAHQISAMIGDFAAFGRIAAATVGVYATVALGIPMRYNVQAWARPVIPDDRLLQIMAVKPDISIDEFRKYMAYHGYSDYWIDRIQRTMYHEPRYFELKMMSEDHAATEEWLFTKSRRAGFTEEDSRIMVSSYIKSATRTQRMDYYRQAFYLYKEGFIRKEVFDRLLAALELRPEALDFAKKAADLAYMLDYTKDLVTLYRDQYLKDLISEDELRLAYVALGMPLERADLLVRKAVIRKKPKPAQREKPQVEKAATQLRTKYMSLYRELYRKDLIDEQQYLAYLRQLGITDELAEVTVALEQVKKFKPAAG